MNYENLTKNELLNICEELGIHKVKSKNKTEIISLIKNKNTDQISSSSPVTNNNTDQISSSSNVIKDISDDNQITHNNYYVDDNLNLLKIIKNKSIDLIYFDPPYNTGRNFYDFDDKFKTKNDYLNFIKLRIIECHRILKDEGTIVIHIEPKISHYYRVMCDEIFGDNNFRNEIVWQTGGNAKNKYKLNRFHDTIIVYSKSNNQIFNPMYFNYDEEYRKKSNVKFCNIHNKEYVTTALYNSQPDVNPRLNLRYEWKGHTKQWYVTREKMENLDNENRLEYNKDGVPRIKRFLDEMEGIPLRDIWCDITNTQTNEKIDYATQKPVKLLERIVKLYSNEQNICMDIFAGSGTLGRACLNTNRNYILFDINPKGKEVFLESIKQTN